MEKDTVELAVEALKINQTRQELTEALRINKKRLSLIENARSKMDQYDKGSEMGRYLTNFVVALEECEAID